VDKNLCLKILFIAISAGACMISCAFRLGADDNALPIRLGYFHGGRTVLLLRAYENAEFDKNGIPVEFYSKRLYEKNYKLIPKSIREFNQGGGNKAGAVTGTEFMEEVMNKQFDLAVVGESSFIRSVCEGQPVVAIAELGHDVRGHSGHVFAMKKGFKAARPSDYLGKVLISRRAGAADAMFLREFLKKEGLDTEKQILQLDALPSTREEKRKLPKNKVIIVDNLFEDKMQEGIARGVIDGGYFHLMAYSKITGSFKMIRPLHYWADPELSHALLVCRKEFLENNKERLTAFLEVYIKRIQYEHGLSYEDRTKKQPKGLQMAVNLDGLNYPQYDIVPIVNPGLLYRVMGLLRKYNYIADKNVKIEDFIDNSLVYKALENLGIGEKDDHWQSEY